jgi:hypothetical protein
MAAQSLSRDEGCGEPSLKIFSYVQTTGSCFEILIAEWRVLYIDFSASK